MLFETIISCVILSVHFIGISWYCCTSMHTGHGLHDFSEIREGPHSETRRSGSRWSGFSEIRKRLWNVKFHRIQLQTSYVQGVYFASPGTLTPYQPNIHFPFFYVKAETASHEAVPSFILYMTSLSLCTVICPSHYL